MKVKVWADRYVEDRYELVTCEVEGKGSVALANGVRGYIITSPDGKTYVAETTTGGIIGRNVEDARTEIKRAPPGAIAEAIKKIKGSLKTAVKVKPEEFWALL